MISAVANVFKIRDLRNKILFTVALLIIYRIGFHITCPGFDVKAIQAAAGSRDTDSPLGRAAQYMQIFTGGTLDNSTLFGLGVMPYITASIILMLLGEVVPSIRKLRQEGQVGHRKIQEYTRYLTVPVCIIQALMYVKMLGQFIYPGTQLETTILAVVSMTASSMFLMWLGEQIDEYGVGNGISLIIMAGIIDRMPWAIQMLIKQVDMTPGGQGVGPGKLIFLVAAFVGVVAGTILISQAQRRIPIQQAKMMRGHRMFGCQRSYIPLRVNGGGVMPIVFASSLMMFPPIVVDALAKMADSSRWGDTHPSAMAVLLSISAALSHGAFTYTVLYMLFIFVFAYFWVTVQFQPREWAKNLRDSGSFVPGLRPGKRTADYLETVMMRITYYGAAFLSIIAVVPTMVSTWLGIDWRVSTFLGGTGLLIVVSVSLDLVQKIEAGLLMHSYEGFSDAGRIKGAYS
jgi:preprotein translocase subunit SecY